LSRPCARGGSVGIAADPSRDAEGAVTDALRESPLEGRREKALKSTQAAELLQLIDALERLEKTFSTAGNTSPFIPKPRPSLRVRQPN
jgi:hypothetical protein